MKLMQLLLVIFFLSLLFLIACSDLQKGLPEPVSTDLEIHPPGWNNDTSSVNFHGKYLWTKSWSGDGCKSCHGSIYSGGTSGKLCFRCHNSYPHEAKFIIEEGHEIYLQIYGYEFDECETCHGADLLGGTRVKISCSITDCHTDAGGNAKSPEACNTCHGRFKSAANDTLSWAPPHAIVGDTATTYAGVGAHQAHLKGVSLSSNARCNQCHEVPSEVFIQGHLDSQLPAEVVFNASLAALITADSTFQPSPSYDTLHCSGTYCHGAWKLRRESSPNKFAFSDSIITGAFYNPSWIRGISEKQCGSCHALPPAGHLGPIPVNACSGCHTGVVDGMGDIADKSKHINGKVNYLTTERPF